MQQLTALRPLVIAGVAAVGASLIALAPAVSNDVAADLQRSVVNIQVELTDNVVNPVATWIDVLQTSGANLQSIFNQWSEIPFPVLQQMAANALDYAGIYVGAYQTAAMGASNFYTSTSSGNFFPALVQAVTAFREPDFTTAFEGLDQAFWTQPLLYIFEPLENTLKIPTDIAQNFANFVAFMDSPFLSAIGYDFVTQLPPALVRGLGEGVQNIYDAFASGDLLGGLTNVVNLPGVFAQAALNGVNSGPGGILTPTVAGLLYTLAISVPVDLSQKLVAPGAQDIVQGGSVSSALSAFLTQLTTDWPSLQAFGDQFINAFHYFVDAAGFSTAANVAGVGDFAAAASAAGAFPVDIASVAPSIAADLSGLAPSVVADLAGRLPVEFGTLAANVLTSLF
ncbi:hypothetical protein K3U93_05640 [Mycobacterium malmoense]|uniref:PE-PGRS family protein n=1 Tax=Mycobacterium malmoense TaxID=1780 RepID=A0ABX3SMF9_MYCMA|nr:hypothetical protein [Mycobacterium malmoense]OIN81690.1 hypothetical protein BMG05_06285 [Mycobacterium malmoense]ORA77205.1 hypothetical protein BST29_23845 [Mycobacterium malmoense]QZA18671.1 hypothetical protein K3U93_05640 [Mycobacterium malmoense]UNB95444.1 hypothetical protein H5T25_05635 [Mycobacterium malmoense]